MINGIIIIHFIGCLSLEGVCVCVGRVEGGEEKSWGKRWREWRVEEGSSGIVAN